VNEKKDGMRVGVFVDVQNIYYTSRDTFGRQFNYRQLWKQLETLGEIVVAYAYAIDRGDERQRKFQSALEHIGFTDKLKPYIQRKDGSAKADWDVGITIDVLDSASQVDTVVLLSGDGDFDLLARKLRDDLGIAVEVFGVRALTAQSLIESASRFHSIDEDLLL
jgi:uncharacterized LabA/DUF88 family protein